MTELYLAANNRYTAPGAVYRRAGASGVQLPALSLGLWQNFGATVPLDRQRAIVRRAFDLGVTHFDLANNYGPPYGAAEEDFGRHIARDFRPYRDEMIITSKAGYDMWPGPYGNHGSRKYLMASVDQSLRRLAYLGELEEAGLIVADPPRTERRKGEWPVYRVNDAEVTALYLRLGQELGEI